MQKFLKIVVAFLLVISLSMPNVAMNSVSAAEQWTEYPANTTGDVNKAWKVTFSDLVNSSTVSQQNVYVKKANGQPVDVTVTVNGSTITVTPNAPYTVGETYTLYLHSSIQSVKEQALPNTTFQFTVLSALEIAKSVAQEAKSAAEAIKTGQPIFANPYAGTKDELTRANAFVADLEKAIAAANEKVRAAHALIDTAKAAGATVTELAGANANLNAATNAIKKAESAVLLAQEVIKTASVASQLAVASVTVQTSSTIDVTLVSAPAYELTKADADKFRVMMDGTLLLVTDVVKSSNNLEYTLTIATATTKYPLFGKQGILSVNNTRAVIPNSEFGYDFKAPTIDKVEVLDSRHVRVIFSENMGDSAATVENYDIYKEKTTTPDLLTGTDAVAVLSADKKSVTLTLGGKNELAAGDYTLKVTGVTDVAGNNIRPNTTIEFPVTKDQLVDTTRPSLTAADYDSENGILNVTFDEKVTIANIGGFSLGGVKLTGSTGIASNEGTKHPIQVSNKEAVNEKLTNPLRLTIALGAVKDAASNNNSLTNYDLSVAIPPKATQASYSEYTKRLRIIFDQPIQMASVEKAKIEVEVKGTKHPLTGGTIISTENGTTLTIELTKADSQEIEKNAGETETGKVRLAAAAVKNTTDRETANGLQIDIPLTYIQDTGKPRMEEVTVSAVANRDNDTIEVEFTEPMEESSAKNFTNYVFTHGTPGERVTLSNENATIEMSADLKKVTISLKGINLQKDSAFSLQVSNMIDLTGELLEPELRTGKVVGDNTPPTIKSVMGIASDVEDTIIIELSEAVKKETAEEIKNYEIIKVDKSSVETTITSNLISTQYNESDSNNDGIVDKFEAVIKYTAGTLFEHGKVKVKNASEADKRVIDLAGNSMVNLTAIESDVTDRVTPTINSVQGRTVQNGAVIDGKSQDGLDEIIVTFSENVKKATAENPANYKLIVRGNTVSLANLTAGEDLKYDSNTKTATLYLDTSNKKNGHDADDFALKNGEAIFISANDIEDEKGNKIVPTNNSAEGKVNHPNNDNTAAILVENGAKVTGANTIQLTWNEELDGATLFETDFVLVNKGVTPKPYQITAGTLDETKKIISLTTKESIKFDEELELLLKGSKLTDLAGIPVTTLENVDVSSLGTSDSYSLKGESVAAASAKYISIGKNQQISDLFKLSAGTTANREGFTVDTISFDVKTTARVLDKVQLMWSTDAKVDNSDVVVSTVYTNINRGILTFEGINKEIASAGDGYFYLVSDISYDGRVTVELLAGATAISTQTKFSVVSTGSAVSEEIIIDITAPILAFEGSSEKEIVVKVKDDSPLADVLSKRELNTGTNYSSIFEIVGQAAGTTIVSATYEHGATSAEGQTFTLKTSAGLPTEGFIRLKAGELIDLAGNPVAATFIAQGNGTDKPFVNPYILNDENPYSGDIIQNKLEEGNVTYGPNTSTVKTITGNVKIVGASAGTITLQNLIISDDLTIATPNATVVIGANVTVGGTLIIEDVSSTGVTNNGTLKDVTILDAQGIRFINSRGTISGKVDINLPTDTNLVKLDGAINTVNVLKPTKLQVESGATITTLTVVASVTADITNNGVINILAGDGTAIERATKAKGYEGLIGANTAVAAIKATTSANSIETVLQSYHSVLGITDLTDYRNLASSYKTTVNTILYNGRASYVDAAAIQTAFTEAVTTQKAFSALKAVTTVADLEKIFTDNAIALGIDLAEYNLLANNSAVNQAIFTGRNSYATVEAFQTAFNNAVATAKVNEEKETALSSIKLQLTSVSDKTGPTNNGKVTATWTPLTAEEISTTGTTSYEIYYAKGSTVTKETAGTPVKISNLTSNSAEISGLDGETDHTFVIFAVNANGAYSLVSDPVTAQALNHVAATAGKVEGTVALADDGTVKTEVANSERTFTVTIDSGEEISVTIPAATETRTALLSVINTAISGKGTASFNANKIVITSGTTGTSSTVSVGGTDKGIFFGTETVTVGTTAMY